MRHAVCEGASGVSSVVGTASGSDSGSVASGVGVMTSGSGSVGSGVGGTTSGSGRGTSRVGDSSMGSVVGASSRDSAGDPESLDGRSSVAVSDSTGATGSVDDDSTGSSLGVVVAGFALGMGSLGRAGVSPWTPRVTRPSEYSMT